VALVEEGGQPHRGDLARDEDVGLHVAGREQVDRRAEILGYDETRRAKKICP